jgi:hypothetical protein
MESVSKETEALREASLLLEAKKVECVREPLPVFSMIKHAQEYVDGLLNTRLREE